jgi:hypothetical protein
MADGKWSNVKAEGDGEPLRVLRVGFDRSVWLLNGRGLESERALIQRVKQRLAELS